MAILQFELRLAQQLEGIPVEGGELIAHFDRSGHPVSLTGFAVPTPDVSIAPTLSAAGAGGIAQRAIDGDASTAVADVTLVVFDTGAAQGRDGTDHLAYKVTLVGPETRELVFVDAHDGSVVGRFTGIHNARNRLTYDMHNNTNYGLATLERAEGDPSVGDTDIDNAHDYAGDTYDFWFNGYGRDSIDDSGFTLKSYTHYGSNYQNAFWDGQRMTYGDGFSVDDVTGHEITHGLTEHTANLVYAYQPGALNESMSDIFGESIDQLNGAGDDSQQVKWLLGEDIPGIGAIRDLSNPPAYSDPDKVTSPLYYCGAGDNGGVHTNSGVPNKNFSLLTDGGSFNGRTVQALGLIKAVAIHYRNLTNYLGTNSQFRSHFIGLWRSCKDLIGVDLSDPVTGAPSGEVIGDDDCTQVVQAGLAVEFLRKACR